MALAVRELELILIARDHASAVIARVGGAMAILGGMIVRVGLSGVKEFGQMTSEAITFRQAIALAVTQADGLGATIEGVAGIVNRVGGDLPVPFEELNEAMFDIFSTFTHDQLSSMEQAEMILRAFGESAVAGQAPVRDIARSTIAWINALDQPATLENITKLLDIQFELVRKGAGTYEEFAGEVGKAIPAFAAANQTVETFGGIMAFLTKNGLNAAMAATSAARAAELMFSPKAIKGLGAVGIAVEDNEGNFRAMEDIIRDLVPVMGSLTDAQKKLKFKEIFGTGRIQARRFFDLAIPNFAELEELIGDMEQAGGGVANAFAFMFDQPLSQMELFRNKWELLRRTIGNIFVKDMESTLFPALNRLFDWWDELTPEIQEQIARWGAWATVIAVVSGALLVVMGIGLIFVALLKSFGAGSVIVGFSKLVVLLGWIAVVFAIIAGAAFLIFKNWDKIGPFLSGIWDSILGALKRFVEANKEFLDEIAEKARIIWDKILELGTAVWNRAKAIWSGIWDAILVFWDKWGEDIMAHMSLVWESIQDTMSTGLDIIIGIIDFFIALFEGDWDGMWEAIKSIGASAWEWITDKFELFTATVSKIWDIVWTAVKSKATEIWDGIKSYFAMTWDNIKDKAADVWNGIKNKATEIWNGIKSYLAGVWDSIKSKAADIWNGIIDFFKNTWASIVGTAKDTIDGEGGLLPFFQKLPGRIIEAVFNFAALLITWMGEALGWLLATMIDKGAAIFIWFLELPFKILEKLADAATWLWETGRKLIKGLWDGIKWFWANAVIPFFTELLPAIGRFFVNVVTWLWETGNSILTGLLNGIKWVWKHLILFWLKDIPDKLIAGIGNVARALFGAGESIIDGFLGGMKDAWGRIITWAEGVVANLTEAIKKALGITSPSKVFMQLGKSTMLGYELGLKSQMKPIELMMSRYAGETLPRHFGSNIPSNSDVTNNNENGQTFQFGDIITQGDPEEVAAAIAWELRMV